MATHSISKQKKKQPIPAGTPTGPMGLPICYNTGDYEEERKKRDSKMQQRRKRYRKNKLMELPSVY